MNSPPPTPAVLILLSCSQCSQLAASVHKSSITAGHCDGRVAASMEASSSCHLRKLLLGAHCVPSPVASHFMNQLMELCLCQI